MSTYHLYKTPTILPTRLQFYDGNNAHRTCQLLQLFMINKQTSHMHTTMSSKNARNNLNQHTVASIHINRRIKYLNIVETTQQDMLFIHQSLKYSLVKRVEMLQHEDSLRTCQLLQLFMINKQTSHTHTTMSSKYARNNFNQHTVASIHINRRIKYLNIVETTQKDIYSHTNASNTVW